MTEIINMDAFIEIIAKRANFAKKDVKIILDTIVEIFTEVVVKGQILKIRGLGKLYTQIIPERKGNKGQVLPPADRVIFKLSENIRYAKQGFESNISDDEDLDNP